MARSPRERCRGRGHCVTGRISFEPPPSAQQHRERHDNGRISCVTVIPGYDDTKIRKSGLKAGRQDDEVYRVLWQEAIKAKPDWVLITSWNHLVSESSPYRRWWFPWQAMSITTVLARIRMLSSPSAISTP
jgi:hypothetical protein